MVRNVEREESHLPAEADDSMIHSSQDHMSRMSDQSRDFQRSKSEKDFIAEATGPSGEILLQLCLSGISGFMVVSLASMSV